MIKFTQTAIEIYGFPIRYYGIMIALGVLAGIILAERREKRYLLRSDTVIDLSFWVLPAAIIGARLYYIAFNLNTFKGNLLSIFNLRSGGLAIYGGILLGALSGILFARKRKLPVLSLIDLAAPSVAIGQAIGRWGNFFNQEAFGVRIENSALQFFPMAVYIDRLEGWFAATFFYESAWCFLICLFILILEKKKRFQKPGDCAMFYGLMYAFERAIVESLRTDSLMLGSVRISQALSAVVLAAIGIFLLFRVPPSKKRRLMTLISSSAALVLILYVLAGGLIHISAFITAALAIALSGLYVLVRPSEIAAAIPKKPG